MSTTRKKLLFNSVSVSLDCSICCRKPKLSSIFRTKQKPKTLSHIKNPLYHSPSSSSTKPPAAAYSPYKWYNDTSSQSDAAETDTIKCSRNVGGFGRVGGESVAVEKDSDDPYLDFRHSMLQMILENEIYSRDDLSQLLNCFLQLNSPYHHGIIVRAFTEIWNGVISARSGYF